MGIRSARAFRRGRALLAAAAVLLGSLAAVVAMPAPSAHADPAGQITEYPIPSPAGASGIVSGSDGNVWLGESVANKVAKVTPSGTVTEYDVPTPNSAPAAFAAGPDGNVWFTEYVGNKIAKVTPAGVFTEYAVPTTNGAPIGITTGADGNLWFTELSAKVAKITTSGAITEYTVPTFTTLHGIAAGPDGNLWFTEESANKIGKVTTSGTVTEYDIPTANSEPTGIAAGPDGNVWFTEVVGDKIGRITPSGTISEFAVPTAASYPTFIASDGAHGLWFTESDKNARKIARISSTDQGFLEFPLTSSALPNAITSGPQSTMWFTESNLNEVGKIGTELGASGEFTPLTPARIFDTRDGTGGRLGPLSWTSEVDVQVTGTGGVPGGGVSAVVLNATVTNTNTPSYLTIYPTLGTKPFVSNLNFVGGQTVPNLVIVGVGTGGKVTVYNNAGTTDVILDVVGYFATTTGNPGSRFHPLTPARLFDTRNNSGGVGTSPLGPGGTLHFTVAGKGGVPGSGVTAVVMNVTVTQPTAPSFLTVYPDDVSPRPLASNLNYVPGQTVPNLVVVRVPASGVVDFYNNSGTAHVLADVVGYFDGDKTTEAGRLLTGTPARLFDTRSTSPFPPPGAVPAGGVLTLGGVPTGVGALVLNVTVTAPTTSGYLTVFPDPPPAPLASNLNFVAGQTVPNLVIVRVGDAGKVDFYNSAGSTQVVADLFGLFTDATFYADAAPSSPAQKNSVTVVPFATDVPPWGSWAMTLSPGE